MFGLKILTEKNMKFISKNTLLGSLKLQLNKRKQNEKIFIN
jgi:hypothetical protein